MLRIWRRLFGALDRRERRRGAVLLVLMVIVAFAEAAGVASVMPFVAVLSRPDAIQSNRYLAFAYRVSGAQSRNDFLVLLGVTVFLALIASLALKALGVWAQLRYSQRRSATWSARLVAGYLAQPYEWFLNRHSAELASNVLAEVHQVVTGALLPALQALASALAVASLILLLVAIDPVLALTAAGFLGGLYGLISWGARSRLGRIGRDRSDAIRVRFRVLSEGLGGIKDVKVGGLEQPFVSRFEVEARRLADSNIAAGILGQLPSLGMQAVLFGGMLLAVVYLIGTHGQFERALPVITVFAFAGYRLMPGLQTIYQGLSEMRFSEAAVDLLCDHLASYGAPRRPDDGPTERLHLGQTLELRDLWYRYPEASEPTLRGLDLVIPARTTVGLVGSTGSGKTTTVDVLLGLLRPEGGALMVDGRPVTQSSQRAWQRSIGYVPQHIFLADDTVEANIAFGVAPESIDHAAVEHAAKVANLHQFVTDELPNGYSTTVGERGIRLSGGQRQRVGIARALYRDPDLLILDEATSALDAVTEEAVMDAVQNLGGRKTIILVAHRLTTVRRCDCIHLLERGRVVASGPFGQLLGESQQFRALAAQYDPARDGAANLES
jgi:ABC-type multidrug transport system fused ATPase/permease subunit